VKHDREGRDFKSRRSEAQRYRALAPEGAFYSAQSRSKGSLKSGCNDPLKNVDNAEHSEPKTR